MPRTKVKSSHTPKGQFINKKINRVLFVGAGVIMAILIGLWALNAIRVEATERAVLNTRLAHEPDFDADQTMKIAKLAELGAIVTETPAYSSKIDVCYIDSDDQGWTAVNYHQDCYIRYVDLFVTDLSRADILRKIETDASSKALFGDEYSLYEQDCDTMFQTPGNRKADGKVPETIVSYYSLPVSGDDADSYNCQIPNPIQGFSTVRGRIHLDSSLTKDVKRTFNKSDVDSINKYVIVETDSFYYYEDMGCGVGFMCPSPRADPITGF